MAAKKELNIGIVGYGFMGRTHSNAFLQAPRFFDRHYLSDLGELAQRGRRHPQRDRRCGQCCAAVMSRPPEDDSRIVELVSSLNDELIQQRRSGHALPGGA